MSGDKIINGSQEAIGGDLISREAACDAAEVYPEDGVIGEQSYWFTMGAMAAREAIRAHPATPAPVEAGLIESLLKWCDDRQFDVVNCLDLRADEEASAVLWIENFRAAIRALPAAPEAGEVYLLRNQRDNLVTNLERAEARLAVVGAERDAIAAAAFEAAARWLIDAGLAGDAPEDPLASCIRALTSADALAALSQPQEPTP